MLELRQQHLSWHGVAARHPRDTRLAEPICRRPRSPSSHPATLVLLVRHGTTPSTGQVLPGRAPGLHLADAGRDQAARLGERLADWAPADGARPRIAAIYASPLERTRETAAPVAAALGLRVRVARGLIECDFGEWTGEALKQLMKRPEWATVQRYPSGFRFPSGESFAGMQARMVASDGGPAGPPPRRNGRRRVPRRSRSRRSSPTPSAPTSTSSSASSSPPAR